MKSGRYNVNSANRDTEGTTGAQTQSHHEDEGKAQMCRGRRCLVLMTVCLGLICVLLLVFIILQIITTRDLLKSYKNTVEELNQTINILQDNYTDLMIDKDQLQDIYDFVIQKKLELETTVYNLTEEKGQLQGSVDSLSLKKLELEIRVNDLSVEKSQLQGSVDSLTQKKLELERNVTSLNEEIKKETSKQCGFFTSTESKSWSESRQYCRDRGADLVIINSEDKQRCISSFIKESVWIGLSDIESERTMKWVDNSQLNQGYWAGNEPNDLNGNEDCIELIPGNDVLSNWNDLPCSLNRKCVCAYVPSS